MGKGDIMRKKPVLVIGHRHPDTDSVCSAIAYAYLKRQMGMDAEPARAGKLNPETAFVLDHFDVPVPRLINYFYPVLEDIRLFEAPTVREDASLRDVGRLFVDNPRLKSVPVLDGEDGIAGIITVGDLAKRLFKGKIKIGASRTETLKETTSSGDLVIMGDREDVQKELLELGGVGLILTRNTPVSDEVRKVAESHDGIIIRTPMDSYTTARMINQSIPVRLLMTRNVVSFNSSDLLSDVKNRILTAKYVSYPVLRNGKYAGIVDRGMMLEPERQQVVLVDHNEHSQAAEGIEETRILEIIDHHRLGGLTTGAPIYIRQEPVGSTATIVANMTWNANVSMPPRIAGLLFSAIVSDTLYFRSPTATATDKVTAERLAVQAGIEDPEGLAMEILRAGSVLNTMSAEDIIRNDFKEFDFGKEKITVSQINIMDRKQAEEHLEALQKALDEFRRSEGYDLSLLMVTDILGETTVLLFSGKRTAVLDAAFGARETERYYLLPGVLSRKKQVIPPLSEAFRRI